MILTAKPLLALKLTILFLSTALFQASAKADAQGIIYSAKNAPLEQVLKAIEHQTNYVFFYRTDDIARATAITVNLKNASIEEALKEIFEQQPLTWSIKGNTIVLKPKSGLIMTDKNKFTTPASVIEITGRVLDDNGKPIEGVSVSVKGAKKGTVTDKNGYYKISVNDNVKILVFSHVAYNSEEVLIEGRNNIDIRLTSSATNLDDVILTGYQKINKREATSAVVSIKVDSINQIGATSIDKMMQGRIPGLSVMNSSAAAGAAPKIRIRGTATISGNADPVWVLDGVILDNPIPLTPTQLNSPDILNFFNSSIGGISPNDIESITILKDASATAIYGTKAANGVIVLTTKKGKEGKLRINFNHTSKISSHPGYNNFNQMNSKERVLLSTQLIEDGLAGGDESAGFEKAYWDYLNGAINLDQFQSEVQKAQTANTDWFKLLFRNAYTQTNNLSFSGGSAKTNYYASLNYSNEQGLANLNYYKQYAAFLKLNSDVSNALKIGLTIQAGRRDRRGYHSSFDPFTYAFQTSRCISPYDSNGMEYFYNGNSYNSFNVFNEMATTGQSSKLYDIKTIGNISLNLTKKIKFNSLLSFNASTSGSNEYADDKSYYIAGIRGYDFGNPPSWMTTPSSLPVGGILNTSNYTLEASLIRNSLEFRPNLGHQLSTELIAGQELRFNKYSGQSATTYGYMRDRGMVFYNPPLIPDASMILRNTMILDNQDRAYVSYYGTGSIMFKNRYIFNSNIRFDGSNLFGSNPKYRYLPLWSVSGRWNMSDESFLRNNKLINNISIRSSFGFRGNIVEESSPQIIASALPPNPRTSQYEMSIIQAPNPNLKWEVTQSFNLGVDFSFLNNRLSGTFDYYKEKSSDLLASKELSAVTGFQTQTVNYADVANNGIELYLNAEVLKSKNFSWSSRFNFAHKNNKVTNSLITAQAENLIKTYYVPGNVVNGRPINALYSYRFAGLNDQGIPKFYDDNNNILNYNDPLFPDKVFTNVNALKYEGSRDPIITGGWENSVRFKNFKFSFLFTYGLDFAIRLPDASISYVPMSGSNLSKDLLNRWRKPGDELTKYIPAFSFGNSYFYSGNKTYYASEMFNKSDKMVVKGNYLRLQNILLDYAVPHRKSEKYGIKEFHINLQIQNLFVLADKRLNGMDPETANFRNIGGSAMPLPKTVSLGLNINF